MTSTAGLYVAISKGGGVYKHWTLFIDGPTENRQIVLQAEGTSTKFHFEREFLDHRSSESLLELINLCNVPLSNIPAIDQAAEQAPIHNRYPGYNCQNYILELLDDLETKGLIDRENAKYKTQKTLVAGKQEGLD